MKIAIPTNNADGLNSQLADHFGRCQNYVFINEKGELIETADNTSRHMGGGELPPKLIKKLGADILLCKDLGPQALDLCKELEIEVYIFQAETVQEIFQIWEKNKAKKASSEDTCKQHRS